jgi:glycosyltransferase involved in cell wall biosynthesis
VTEAAPAPPLPLVIQVAAGRVWRGGERQVLLLARALRDLGIDQLVITNDRSRLAAELTEARIPLRPVRWRAGLSAAAMAAVWAEARRRPAILHAHDAHSLTVAGVAALLTNRPLVVTRRLDRPLRRRGFWDRADRIIAVSGAVRRVLEADGIDPSRIVVVHSAVDLARARAVDSGSIRAQLDVAETAPLVASVGALAAEKGHRHLIEAAALLHPRYPDLLVAIAGAGPLRPILEQLVADRGLATVVRFLGEVPEPTALVRAATVFASASIQEAFGGAILEAMAVGTPVVATRVGGVPELVAEGAGVLVEPADPAQLAAAIGDLLGDQNARERVSREATRRGADFGAAGMAAKVLQVYRSVVIEH